MMKWLAIVPSIILLFVIVYFYKHEQRNLMAYSIVLLFTLNSIITIFSYLKSKNTNS